jgi:hypothetical protein
MRGVHGVFASCDGNLRFADGYPAIAGIEIIADEVDHKVLVVANPILTKVNRCSIELACGTKMSSELKRQVKIVLRVDPAGRANSWSAQC